MKTAGKDLLICVKPMKNLFHENVFVRQSMHLTGKEYVCACACVRACVCVCVCECVESFGFSIVNILIETKKANKVE